MTDNSIEFNVNTIFNDNINVTDPYNISISDVNIANNPTSKSAVNAQSVVNYLTPLISELNDNIDNIPVPIFPTTGLSSTGYQIFPNGLIMQWLYGYSGNIHYYPIAFPHAVFGCYQTLNLNGHWKNMYGVYNVNTSSVSTYITGYMFVIGY